MSTVRVMDPDIPSQTTTEQSVAGRSPACLEPQETAKSQDTETPRREDSTYLGKMVLKPLPSGRHQERGFPKD